MNASSQMRAPVPLTPFKRISLLLEHFWQAFVAPSRFSFFLTMATFLGLLGLVCVGITQEFIAGPSGRFLARDPADSHVFATRGVLQLGLLPQDKSRQQLYVLGDSIVAHAFIGERALAHLLSKQTGRAWDVSFLTTAGQDPMSEAVLADNATRRTPGVTLIPLYPTRFPLSRTELVEAYRLGLIGSASRWADADMAALGEKPDVRTGIYAIDNYKFLLRNLHVLGLRLVTRRAATRRIDSYVRHRRPDELQRNRNLVLKALRSGKAGRPGESMTILIRTIESLRKRGSTVVLVEDPFNEAIFENARDRVLYHEYLRDSAAFADRLGVHYCSLSDVVLHQAPTFADYYHVVDGVSRAGFSEALSRCVAEAEKERAA